MEANKDPQPPLIDQLKQYAEIRVKLAKYKAIDKGSSIVANLLVDVVVIISMVMAFVFISFTLAFYLSKLFASYWEGFGCVALLYVIIALAIRLNKKSFEKSIANILVQKAFKK
jgi:hypothetical protein